MQDYLAKIELKTNLYTSIHGDSLFGMICWMILYLEGENVLTEFLNDSEKSPQAIFSSAFPENYLPIPNLPKIDLIDEEYKYLKKLKKEKYISLEYFLKNRKNFSIKEFQNFRISEYKSEETKLKLHSGKELKSSKYIPHNSINRLTGMVEETGGLFFSCLVAEPNTKYDIYISVETKWAERIKKAFFSLGEFGYGKDSSIG